MMVSQNYQNDVLVVPDYHQGMNTFRAQTNERSAMEIDDFISIDETRRGNESRVVWAVKFLGVTIAWEEENEEEFYFRDHLKQKYVGVIEHRITEIFGGESPA
jgi:hypothetical protein